MNTQNTHNLGYLVIWRMADVAAPYADLEALAKSTGFDSAYVPTPPQARHAWEKATNLKKQKLIPSTDLVVKVKARYGCEPYIKAETKIISSDTRHIVRSLIIKSADDKDKQLDMKSVAILKFEDANANDLDKFVALYHPDFDPQGAVNGNINVLIGRMQTEYRRQLIMADGQDVRYRIRAFLDGLKATCLADGTYFVPDNVPGAADKLVAFQDYVLGLEQYRQTESTLTCQVYWVTDDGSAFAQRNRSEVTSGVVTSLKNRLAQVLKDLTTPDGRGAQATARRREQAMAEFLEAKAQVKLYQEALGDELQALQDVLQMTQKAYLGSLEEA